MRKTLAPVQQETKIPKDGTDVGNKKSQLLTSPLQWLTKIVDAASLEWLKQISCEAMFAISSD